ncbi:hypothetical protein MHYP_G00140010 [Metynnis hypsauchen]
MCLRGCAKVTSSLALAIDCHSNGLVWFLLMGIDCWPDQYGFPSPVQAGCSKADNQLPQEGCCVQYRVILSIDRVGIQFPATIPPTPTQSTAGADQISAPTQKDNDLHPGECAVKAIDHLYSWPSSAPGPGPSQLPLLKTLAPRGGGDVPRQAQNILKSFSLKKRRQTAVEGSHPVKGHEAGQKPNMCV